MLAERTRVLRQRQFTVTLYRAGRVRARMVQSSSHEYPVLEAWLGRVGLMEGDELELQAPGGRLVVQVTGGERRSGR
jgi:hypothetical protein